MKPCGHGISRSQSGWNLPLVPGGQTCRCGVLSTGGARGPGRGPASTGGVRHAPSMRWVPSAQTQAPDRAIASFLPSQVAGFGDGTSAVSHCEVRGLKRPLGPQSFVDGSGLVVGTGPDTLPGTHRNARSRLKPGGHFCTTGGVPSAVVTFRTHELSCARKL